MSDVMTGSCHCGGVSYEVHGELRPVIYCHCSQCRKTSGNFVGASACDSDALVFTSERTLTWYRASPDALRGFCNECGGNILWKPAHGRYVSIFAGTLDDTSTMHAEKHIFVADKAGYVDIADGLPQFAQDDA